METGSHDRLGQGGSLSLEPTNGVSQHPRDTHEEGGAGLEPQREPQRSRSVSPGQGWVHGHSKATQPHQQQPCNGWSSSGRTPGKPVHEADMEDARNLVAFSASVSVGSLPPSCHPEPQSHTTQLYEKFNQEMGTGEGAAAQARIQAPEGGNQDSPPEDLNTLQNALSQARHGQKPPNCDCDGPDCPDYLEWLEKRIKQTGAGEDRDNNMPCSKMTADKSPHKQSPHSQQSPHPHPHPQPHVNGGNPLYCPPLHPHQQGQNPAPIPCCPQVLSIAKEKNVSLQTAIAIEALTQLSATVPQTVVPPAQTSSPSHPQHPPQQPSPHLQHGTRLVPSSPDPLSSLSSSHSQSVPPGIYPQPQQSPVSWEQQHRPQSQGHPAHASPLPSSTSPFPRQPQAGSPRPHPQQWQQQQGPGGSQEQRNQWMNSDSQQPRFAPPSSDHSAGDPMSKLKQLLGDSSGKYINGPFKLPVPHHHIKQEPGMPWVKQEVDSREYQSSACASMEGCYGLMNGQQQPRYPGPPLSLGSAAIHQSTQTALQQHLHHKRNLFSNPPGIPGLCPLRPAKACQNLRKWWPQKMGPESHPIPLAIKQEPKETKRRKSTAGISPVLKQHPVGGMLLQPGPKPKTIVIKKTKQKASLPTFLPHRQISIQKLSPLTMTGALPLASAHPGSLHLPTFPLLSNPTQAAAGLPSPAQSQVSILNSSIAPSVAASALSVNTPDVSTPQPLTVALDVPASSGEASATQTSTPQTSTTSQSIPGLSSLDPKFEELICQFEAEFGDSSSSAPEPYPPQIQSQPQDQDPSASAQHVVTASQPNVNSGQARPPSPSSATITQSSSPPPLAPTTAPSTDQDMEVDKEKELGGVSEATSTSTIQPSTESPMEDKREGTKLPLSPSPLPKRMKIETNGNVAVLSTTGLFSDGGEDNTPTKDGFPLNPSLKGFLESPLSYLDMPTKSLLDTPAKDLQAEFPTCDCVGRNHALLGSSLHCHWNTLQPHPPQTLQPHPPDHYSLTPQTHSLTPTDTTASPPPDTTGLTPTDLQPHPYTTLHLTPRHYSLTPTALQLTPPLTPTALQPHSPQTLQPHSHRHYQPHPHRHYKPPPQDTTRLTPTDTTAHPTDTTQTLQPSPHQNTPGLTPTDTTDTTASPPQHYSLTPHRHYSLTPTDTTASLPQTLQLHPHRHYSLTPTDTTVSLHRHYSLTPTDTTASPPTDTTASPPTDTKASPTPDITASPHRTPQPHPHRHYSLTPTDTTSLTPTDTTASLPQTLQPHPHRHYQPHPHRHYSLTPTDTTPSPPQTLQPHPHRHHILTPTDTTASPPQTPQPQPQTVIRRGSETEKLLCLVRPRPGHHCPNAIIIILIMAWEGVPRALGDKLYRELSATITEFGNPTSRRCGLNDNRTCACQGKDPDSCGASFSFGCSWSMYFNGCKYARSKTPRKDNFQDLATELAPLYKQLAPQAYSNQVCTLTKEDNRTVGEIPEDEQLHVLPLYKAALTDEFGSEEGQRQKMRTGAIQELNNFRREVRKLPEPAKSCRQRRLDAKNRASEKKKAKQQLPTPTETPEKMVIKTEVRHAGSPEVKPTIKKEPVDQCHHPYHVYPSHPSYYAQGGSPSNGQPPALPPPPGPVNGYHPNIPSALPYGYYNLPPNPNTLFPHELTYKGRNGSWHHAGHNASPCPVDKKPDVQSLQARLAHSYSGPGHPEQQHGDPANQCNAYPHPHEPDYNQSRPSSVSSEPSHRGTPVIKQEPMDVPVYEGGNTQSCPGTPSTTPQPGGPWPNGSMVSGSWEGNLQPPGPPEAPFTSDKQQFHQQGPHQTSQSPYPQQQHQHPPQQPSPYPQQWNSYLGPNTPMASPVPSLSPSPSPHPGTPRHWDSPAPSPQPKAWPMGMVPAGYCSSPARGFPDKMCSKAGESRGSTPLALQEKAWKSFGGSMAGTQSPAPEACWDPNRAETPSDVESQRGRDLDEEERWSDSEHNFLDPSIGGVAVAPAHGSILIECARRELHATTPLKRPDRSHPTRISLVFYQHKNMNQPCHGQWLWEAKMKMLAERARERQQEAALLGLPYEDIKPGKKRKLGATAAGASPGPGQTTEGPVMGLVTRLAPTHHTTSTVTVSPYAFTTLTGPYSHFIVTDNQ
ncbi:unnamed protein product [Coregonus sp. 'balchen']|nr:unnamed protein product [Coregonus sp. 'balchen']